jgi:heme-degrading monooxygenase HmoA
MKSQKITRIWHGITDSKHAEEYLDFLLRSGVPDYKRNAGNLSVKILRRVEGDKCHFWTVTEWDSYESIKRFAGEDFEKAKYYPEDPDYLVEFEPHVVHCETFEF